MKELVSLCRKDVDAKVLELAILYFFFRGDGQVRDYSRNTELIINPLKDHCRIVHRYPKVHTHLLKISAQRQQGTGSEPSPLSTRTEKLKLKMLPSPRLQTRKSDTVSIRLSCHVQRSIQTGVVFRPARIAHKPDRYGALGHR